MSATRKQQFLDTPGTLYLLHFAQRYKGAGHYLGWTEEADPKVRVARHLAGAGSPLVQAVVEAGIAVTVAKLWPGTKREERRLKASKRTPKWCPECQLASERCAP